MQSEVSTSLVSKTGMISLTTFEKETQTAFTRCRHILKTMKNVTVAKFELAFTRCRNNLKTVGNLTVRNSLQDFDAKEVCLHLRIDQSRSKSVEKFSVFIIYK